MNKVREYNTKSAKLTNNQAIEIYQRLKRGETQGSLSLEYGISVVQVGRIARGEAWAGVTGAREDRIPNHNVLLRENDAKASEERFRKLMEPKQTPSLYNDPPPYEERDTTATEERFNAEVSKLKIPLDRQVGNSLDELTKETDDEKVD